MKFLLASLLLLSAAAFAQDAPPEPSQAAPAAPEAPATNTAAKQDDKDRMICRTEVETGSLIRSRKRCLTAGQWEQIALQHRNQAISIQENNAGRSMCPAGASC